MEQFSDQVRSFINATSGSAGAMFASTCMQPLDLAKLHIQAGMAEEDMHLEGSAKKGNAVTGDLRLNVFTVCYSIYKNEGVAGLFRGLSPKLVQTLLSTFVYFYCYTYFARTYERKFGRVGSIASLGLTSAAAAVNMTLTLPLEVITTKIQTHHADKAKGGSKNESVGDALKDILKESGVAGLWNGYLPSLILVCNPALNYTIFERLKLRVQVLDMKASGSKRLRHLTLMESFWLGVAAKSIATVLTYPLIRCKVLMQAERNPEEGAHKDTIMSIMRDIKRKDGMAGYFKGCDAQVLNTAIKSGVMLMCKEKIDQSIMKLFFLLLVAKRGNPSPSPQE